MGTFSQVNQWVSVEKFDNSDYITCNKTTASITATQSPLVGTFIRHIPTGAAGNVIYVNAAETLIEIACITSTQFANTNVVSYTLGAEARTGTLSGVSTTHGTHNKSIADLTDRSYYTYVNLGKSLAYSNGTLYLLSATSNTLSTIDTAMTLVTTSNSASSTLYLKAGTRTLSTLSIDRYSITTSTDKLVLKNTFGAYSTTISSTFADHSLVLVNSTLSLKNKGGVTLSNIDIKTVLSQVGTGPTLTTKIGSYVTSTLVVNPVFANHALDWNGLRLNLYNANATIVSGVDLRFDKGTAALPGISFNGDTNTGFYQTPTANPGDILAALNGSPRLWLKDGDTHVQRRLCLHNLNAVTDSSFWSIYATTTTSLNLYNNYSNLAFEANYDGNVSNNYQKFKLYGNTNIGTELKSGINYFEINHTTGYSPLKWQSSGNLTTLAGNVQALSFNATSLRSTKENIETFTESAVDIINNTEVVSFNFIGDEFKNKKIGFIADDTHEYLASKDHDKMELNNSIGLLLKAVQELSSEVIELKKKINILEQK